MTTASAPGKIILFGEHAVVYGRPALAAPVTQVHADVYIRPSPDDRIRIYAPDIDLDSILYPFSSDNPLGLTVHRLLIKLNIFQPPPFTVQILSSIPVASGLGSGAAVSVALIRALSSFLGHPLPDEEVNAFAYEIEKLHHGTPSGIDNTVITYAKPVYFVRRLPLAQNWERGPGGEGNLIETFKVGAPFTIVIGDTGVSAPTKESVGDVRKLWEADQAKWEKVFDQIGQISKSAREQIESGDIASLGALMDKNHALLQTLTVSSPELDLLVEAARRSGASGAKMSGGGRGGNMIALVKPDLAEAVTRSLKEAGARRVIVTEIGS
jgi:mevalonate kinase